MPTLEHRHDYISCRFTAMASPCEVLIDTQDKAIAITACNLAEKEARYIEHKFSRYRKDNIVHQINTGKTVKVDEETARLLDYADKLYQLSDGLFDITSGVLRKVWQFDSSNNIPDQKAIDALLPFIGWNKVHWKNPKIKLPGGMEIDLGGIGKEYAVDRTAHIVQSYLAAQKLKISVLINFGGDIAVQSPDDEYGRHWLIGVDTDIDGTDQQKDQILLKLNRGGVATSGDTRRYVIKDGRRLGHVLNPLTGWPVENAPSQITVAANTCTDAGMLSTLAMLHGAEAENFLNKQGVKYWVRR